jgi:hypothetical protein
MKSVLLIIVGIVAGYFLKSASSASSEVTYNDKGAKTVISSCDKEKDCIISIGQQCESVGYKVVATDHDDMKTIITAECGKEKESRLTFGF